MKRALVLIDIQKDYFTGGRYPLHEPEKVAEKAKGMLELFRESGEPIFHIQHISASPSASFFIPETDGIEIYPLCAPLNGEKVLQKNHPDSFWDTGLKAELEDQGIDTLVICGMMTHMCVDTTVRAANRLGYSVELISDGCGTRALSWKEEEVPAPQVQNAYLAALDGRFAKVLTFSEWKEAQSR